MTYEEIQDAVNELSKQMLIKGCVSPKVKFEIEDNARPAISLIWKEHKDGQLCMEWCFGENPSHVIHRATLFISSLKSKDERNRAEYAAAVAAAIDLGNKYGIEDAAINPLREVMEKLSKNALEHHPAPMAPPVDLGDEIPF